jgi:hypothetical protein
VQSALSCSQRLRMQVATVVTSVRAKVVSMSSTW